MLEILYDCEWDSRDKLATACEREEPDITVAGGIHLSPGGVPGVCSYPDSGKCELISWEECNDIDGAVWCRTNRNDREKWITWVVAILGVLAMIYFGYEMWSHRSTGNPD